MIVDLIIIVAVYAIARLLVSFISSTLENSPSDFSTIQAWLNGAITVGSALAIAFFTADAILSAADLTKDLSILGI